MPIQPYRTRSLTRVKKKTPSGKIVTHYIKRKPARAKCAICKKPLLAVPVDLPYKIRKLPKTQKRPERPYGGVLCSSCMRSKIIEKTPNTKNEKIEPGRLVVKTAGREGGKIAVILEVINNSFVILDGQVKKRKCNIDHIKTLDKKIKVTKNTTKEEIKKEFEKLGYEIKTPKVKKEKPKEEAKTETKKTTKKKASKK